MEVNCLARAVAIALLFVRVLVVVAVVKVMGWFGAVCLCLLESFLSMSQKCEALCLWEHDSTVSIQCLLIDSSMSLEICRSSVCMWWLVGSEVRRVSRSSVTRLVESGRLGMK